MNYTFVIRKNHKSAPASPPLYFILFFSFSSPLLSLSQARRAREQEREREKVESFLIKFQADVALGDA